jgi:hypothetical protein
MAPSDTVPSMEHAMGSLSTPERTTPLMAAVSVKESQPILRNLTVRQVLMYHPRCES